MRPRATRPVFVAAMAFFVVHCASAYAGDSAERLQTRLEEEKSKLEQLRSKIEKQEQKMSLVAEKETSLLRTLSQTGDRLKLKEKELEVYKWNIQINRAKAFNLDADIQESERLLDRQKLILAKRLRTIYKEGPLFPIKVLFSAENMNDLLQRVKYMEMVTSYDASIFQRHYEKLRSLEAEKDNLMQTRAKLLELEQEAITKKEEINREKEEKARFLNKLKNEKSMVLLARKELFGASESLTDLIMNLEKKLAEGEGLNILESKGYLDMPVQGKVLNRFGKKRDKDYDTYIVYNGINIGVPKGTFVRSVFDGKVLYAGSLDGYGNIIIVGHGENFHSLYGHLDEIITSVGKKVRSGQIIAKSGDSGSLVGEALYFELRKDGKPIEPTSWFRWEKK